MQKWEGKEIDITFIVLTPSKYVAARRDALKIEKIKKFKFEYKNVKNIKNGI